MNVDLKQNIGNILILIGGVTFGLAKIIKETFPPFDIKSNEPWQGQSADTIAMYGLTLALSAMIVTGVRTIRRSGFSFKRILLPSIGIGVCSLLALECYSLHKVLVNIDCSEQDKKSLLLLETKLNDESMPLDKKIKLSKIHAQLKFNVEGVRTKYFDSSGKLVDFEPTAKDIEDRDVQIKLKRISQWGEKYPYEAATSWVVVGILSLLLGLFTPVKRDKPNIQPGKYT